MATLAGLEVVPYTNFRALRRGKVFRLEEYLEHADALKAPRR